MHAYPNTVGLQISQVLEDRTTPPPSLPHFKYQDPGTLFIFSLNHLFMTYSYSNVYIHFTKLYFKNILKKSIPPLRIIIYRKYDFFPKIFK